MGLDCGWLRHLMQPSHWSIQHWYSLLIGFQASVLIACCALLVEAIFNTGERSPRMYITRYRSGERRGEGVAAERERDMEIRLRGGRDISFTQSLSIVISLIRASLVTLRPRME